jgi:hypothetical protein
MPWRHTKLYRKKSSKSTGGNGATSLRLANKGYSPSKVRINRDGTSPTTTQIYGFEFTYSSDSCGEPNIVQMIGASPLIVKLSLKNITKPVTAVKFATTLTNLMEI